ncbi:uncharacterized protein G2W53_004198 [Senna tora]|uniref:Uncharacterized protein n=1 Tax=Senna tora TaxID=362788 RepID=A0A834XB95_9FABA|nr:uncharacterized protein G2W53_004198 [Senna tora]
MQIRERVWKKRSKTEMRSQYRSSFPSSSLVFGSVGLMCEVLVVSPSPFIATLTPTYSDFESSDCSQLSSSSSPSDRMDCSLLQRLKLKSNLRYPRLIEFLLCLTLSFARIYEEQLKQITPHITEEEIENKKNSEFAKWLKEYVS